MAAGPIAQTGQAGGRRRYRPLSEINVTPLVDVMLVLLIVFMVTAPLLTAGVPVDLPRTEAAQMTEQVEPLVVTIDAEGAIHVQETRVSRDQLVPRLKAISGARADARIFVRGDRTIRYGTVMQVMGLISASGFSRVALLAEIPDRAAARN